MLIFRTTGSASNSSGYDDIRQGMEILLGKHHRVSSKSTNKENLLLRPARSELTHITVYAHEANLYMLTSPHPQKW